MLKKRRRSGWLLSVVVSVGCGSADPPGEAPADTEAPSVTTGPPALHAVRAASSGSKASSASTTASPLADHGGTVKPTLHLYAVYWGTGFAPTTESLYTTFLEGVGKSPLMTVDAQYLRGAAAATSYGAGARDTSSPPAKALDSDLQAELAKVMSKGKLPYDANGLYLVMTPPSVSVCVGDACSCREFCGYHSAFVDPAHGTVLYAAIPSAAACPTSCGVFATNGASPNGNVEADEGVSVVSHEVEEAQSDAYGTAWYDAFGWENADKCAYRYGPTTKAANGAPVNASWGGKAWLLQMNWSNALGGCAQSAKAGPFQ